MTAPAPASPAIAGTPRRARSGRPGDPIVESGSGYRVESTAIEAAVLRQAGIRPAAVVVDAQGTGPKIALYYRLACGGRGPSPIEIKQHRAQHLPRYILPRSVSCLEELPHNGNGKSHYHRLGRGTAEPVQRPQALPGK